MSKRKHINNSKRLSSHDNCRGKAIFFPCVPWGCDSLALQAGHLFGITI